MGIPWTEQELGTPPIEFLAEVREDIVNHFDYSRWDHNSPSYTGLSNKKIKILGAMLLGMEDVEYEEAKHAVLEAAIGVKPRVRV